MVKHFNLAMTTFLKSAEIQKNLQNTVLQVSVSLVVRELVSAMPKLEMHINYALGSSAAAESATTESALAESAAAESTTAAESTFAESAAAASEVWLPQEAKEIAAKATNMKTNFFICVF